MKAGDAPLLAFLEGKQQFQIPIYQRTYSWGITQCEKLLSDILLASKNSKAHFIGSVVHFQPEITTTMGVPKKLVIDGQQRLTTITILLTAIRNFLKANDSVKIKETSHEEIQDLYLFNPHKSGEDKFKLLLTKKDKETLIQILDFIPLTEHGSKRISDNYNFFFEKISAENVAKIFNGIQNLIIVDAQLEFGKDNPQLIFESLNSTGLGLSHADLIRNFIIMGQTKEIQDRIYAQSWFPMEQLFGENISRMTGFFRDYLTMKTGVIPKLDGVYEAFKSYVQSYIGSDIESEAKELYKVASYYTNFSLNREEDQDLKVVFNDLRQLRVEVSYPLLLFLYIDFKEGLFSKENFLTMLRMIESYVFRRAVCDIPTNSMNKTFSTFHKDIVKEEYLESFLAKFNLLNSYTRFPKNDEFIKAFKVRDVYHFRPRLFLLSKLENYQRKEFVNVEEYTIEHIMPQTLSEQWKKAMGDNWEQVYKSKLHTIGNITLTAYNSEMQNKPFLEKLNNPKGFLNSPFILNEGVRKKNNWGESEILEREGELIKKAVEIFPEIIVPADTLEKYKKVKSADAKEEYEISHYDLTDEMYSLYSKLSQKILNLSPAVTEEFKKLYIAFKAETNFVDIVPQKKRLWLTINLDIDEVYDPQEKCQNIANQGRWGNGNVRIEVAKEADIDYAMEIIIQSLNAQIE